MTACSRRFIACLFLCWTATCGTYYSGPRGSEIYLAAGPIDLPGRFPGDSTIALQFRRGHLTGWKKNWSLEKPWIIY